MRRGAPGPAAIHEVALRMLARRALTERELLERLARKGFGAAAARAELVRLRAAGLVDEEQVAQAVRRETLRTGHGRRAVVAALRRRRVHGEAQQAALEGLDEREALAVAVERATRRHPGWRELPEARRKVVRYLLARGFSPGDVRAALAQHGEQSEHDEAIEPRGSSDLP